MAGALTRWDPFAEIAELRSRFDRVFDEPGGHPQGAWRPSIDVMRRDDTLVVRGDLPGLTPDEVKIEVEDGVLTVSGEHQEDRSDSDGGRYVRRERCLGAFSRSIALPSGVDAQAISAQTRDGVVEVTIPLPSGATTQKIEITPTPASDEG
ncbi:MAG: Hsp20/alpha crystallin family protein [Solirubrobacteraceae bacterium]